MKIANKVVLNALASAVLLALVSLVANAQTGPSRAPTGPVQIISNARSKLCGNHHLRQRLERELTRP
jgi:hypothetical protein